jgi:hypothetical protein
LQKKFCVFFQFRAAVDFQFIEENTPVSDVASGSGQAAILQPFTKNETSCFTLSRGQELSKEACQARFFNVSLPSQADNT